MQSRRGHIPPKKLGSTLGVDLRVNQNELRPLSSNSDEVDVWIVRRHAFHPFLVHGAIWSDGRGSVFRPKLIYAVYKI